MQNAEQVVDSTVVTPPEAEIVDADAEVVEPEVVVDWAFEAKDYVENVHDAVNQMLEGAPILESVQGVVSDFMTYLRLTQESELQAVATGYSLGVLMGLVTARPEFVERPAQVKDLSAHFTAAFLLDILQKIEDEEKDNQKEEETESVEAEGGDTSTVEAESAAETKEVEA